MMYGITGTPGTGKTSIAGELEGRGYRVVHLRDTMDPYVIERDVTRDTLVIDEERWVAGFTPVEGFVEGQLAHLLPCDEVVVLRCRPDVLEKRLTLRNYTPGKIRENVEAEALDVILIETLEEHHGSHIYELDTTDKDIRECADCIERFIKGELPASFGTIDWSAYLKP
ncbi:adenylate kinase [Methanolinea mesophila]|uniref:adenylate kinase family protein n=1 Tax=Methanolinea mesophila TaxID=547055 RepID=UPI001AE5EE26|nr:adenylate kinase family protein [Methanolinea mesophila]MBP1929564.1 adenylate kinase [Methanolinea mesophila]